MSLFNTVQKYAKNSPITHQLFTSITQTHPNLENLALTMTLCDIANKSLFVIGTSGTGKSTAIRWLEKNITRQTVKLGAIGISSFKGLGEQLENTPTSILIEDLSVAKTTDILIKTAFFLTHLTYDHKVIRPVQPYPIAIYNFTGSSIMCMQPYIFRKMLREAEFETDIRDKAIRYYHLYLPLEEYLKPSHILPNIKIQYKYLNTENINIPNEITTHALYQKALDNFLHEFTHSRAEEHLTDLLKAHALLNHKTKVDISDIAIIEHLSRNFKLELEIFSKKHLEGERYLDVDILPLLTIFTTYTKYPIKKLMLHYQVKKTRIYNILNNLSDYVLTKGNPSAVIPTDYTLELLKEIGAK